MPAHRRLKWNYVLGVWTLVGFTLVLQSYLTQVGDPEPYHWLGHFVTIVAQLYRAWLWAALTPFVFALRREIRRRHSNWAVIAFLHLLASITLLFWCNIIRIWAVGISLGMLDLSYFSIDEVTTQLGPFTLVDLYFYWLVLGAGHIYDLDWQKRQNEKHEEQLRTQLAQAELVALRQQVQPHFLFNSLNAISALMREGAAAKATEALSLLSTLLRELMAHAGQQDIELHRELTYADCYLAVEKVRLEERLNVRFEADEDCLDALVPTLILQPLVENAVKHGIAQRRNPGCILITAHREGEWLRLAICNDPAEGGAEHVETNNHGIGLDATRRRLEKIFGARQRLDCTFGGPTGTRVLVEFPLRYAAGRVPEDSLCKA
jgi:two-component system LytT family sensor kinase